MFKSTTLRLKEIDMKEGENKLAMSHAALLTYLRFSMCFGSSTVPLVKPF